MMGRKQDDAVNTELIPLPVAWVKTWTGNTGKTSRVFHSTMGSAQDFQSAGFRRLAINAAYWCLNIENQIDADSSVEVVGPYQPLESGFNYKALTIEPQPPSFYK